MHAIAPGDSKPPTDTMHPRPTRVLVVDDVELNRELAKAILVHQGYDVATVDSGEAAVESVAASMPDLVILDVMMGGMDGFEACRQMRALPGGSELAIVFLTALDDLEAHRGALAAGADDFLLKPIRHVELVIRARSLVRLKRLTREIEHQHEVTKRQRDELATLQRQKDELIALVVHDLKSPLAVMTMDSQFALERGPADDDLRECLESIEGAAGTMLRMVMNLLDISRAEDKALVLHRTRVDVQKIVEEVVRSFARRASEKSLRLEVAAEPGTLDADADMLRRVLQNLLDNACKHTPGDGYIEVAARHTSAGEMELTVSDSGPGVPEQHRERVFEKYAQLDGHRSVHDRGLGLHFCRLAVEAHGGRIWVAANEPVGSRFCVTLPAERNS